MKLTLCSLTCTLPCDRWVATCLTLSPQNSDAPSPPCNKHDSDNEGARWAIERAIAIVYVVFTTVLQRQCRYLLTILYTNKDIRDKLWLEAPEKEQSSYFTFFQVRMDLINTQGWPYKAQCTGKSSFSDIFRHFHPSLRKYLPFICQSLRFWLARLFG